MRQKINIDSFSYFIEERNEKYVEASLSVFYNLSMGSENQTVILRPGPVPVLRPIVAFTKNKS